MQFEEISFLRRKYSEDDNMKVDWSAGSKEYYDSLSFFLVQKSN